MYRDNAFLALEAYVYGKRGLQKTTVSLSLSHMYSDNAFLARTAASTYTHIYMYSEYTYIYV